VREEFVTLEEPLGVLRIEQKDADQAAATPEEYAWSSNLAKNTSGIDYELLMQERYLDEVGCGGGGGPGGGGGGGGGCGRAGRQ
jgi:hypothetical protein